MMTPTIEALHLHSNFRGLAYLFQNGDSQPCQNSQQMCRHSNTAVAAFPPGNQHKYTPSASVSSAVDLLSPSNKALDSSKNQCKIWRQQQHPLLPKPTNYNPVYPLQQPHPTNNINITMVSTTEYPSSSSSIRKLSSFYHSLLQHQPQQQQP